MELGQTISWIISPRRDYSYDERAVFILTLNDKPVASWSCVCISQFKSEYVNELECNTEPNQAIKISLKPKARHYGERLKLNFYKDYVTTLQSNPQILVNTIVHITRQPKYVNLTLTLDREPDYVRYAPPELNLTPPIFLAGSMAKVHCTTDGALPPSPIAFTISCPRPNLATVEHERRLKARKGFPYSVHYRFYKFPSPPTDEELGDCLATEYAKQIEKTAIISIPKDNLSLSATFPIESIAHDCVISCRLMGSEKQSRLTVYYQTSLAYLLPTPNDGVMYAGDSISCYADGYPRPSISLYLKQPLRQFQPQKIVSDQEYYLTTSPTPPVDIINKDTVVASTSRIGLPPNEYSIIGSRFTLAYNATPGVELVLVCTAINALPSAIDFLGANKTIATARFVVSAVTYSSIGIVLGICLVILVLAIVVIVIMVCLRRRQKYARTAMNTRPTSALNGAKLNQLGTAARHTDGKKKKATSVRSAEPLLTGKSPTKPSMYDASIGQPPPDNPSDNILYAELDLTPAFKTTACSSFGRRLTATSFPSIGELGSGDSVKKPNSSLSQQLDDPDHTDYVEIVGIMQPKAYTSQLVLKQQQEATQTILAMHQSKPSVFV